jgi:hypothetical protein
VFSNSFASAALGAAMSENSCRVGGLSRIGDFSGPLENFQSGWNERNRPHEQPHSRIGRRSRFDLRSSPSARAECPKDRAGLRLQAGKRRCRGPC